MGKERKALEQLSEIVTELDLRPGDRLPAERKLAGRMGMSRNTLRNILRMLQTRGLVHIRPGSGTYLKTRLMSMAEDTLKLPPNPNKLVADQLEASYMFLPIMAGQCAERIEGRQLNELQQCNIALSRHLFSDSPQKAWSECLSFFRIMALGTKNEFVVRTVEQICSDDVFTASLLDRVGRTEREAVFAGHVKILNALRQHDADEAAQQTRSYLLRLCAIVEKHNEVRLTEMLTQALQGREEVWETA